MDDTVTVRSRSNMLIGLFGGIFPLLLVAAPIGSGIVRALWVLLMLALVALVISARRSHGRER